MIAPLHPDDRLHTPAPARTLVTLDGLPGGRVAALVVGEITDTTAPPLRRSLLAALGSSSGGLDLDLSAVAFCDVAGLHLLLNLRAHALEKGRTLRVTAASPLVRQLLEATARWTPLTATPASAAPSLLLTTELRRVLVRPGGASPVLRGAGGTLQVRIEGAAATVTWPAVPSGTPADGTGRRLARAAVASALHRAGLRTVRHRSAAATRARTALFVPPAAR
ncbi:STAS domain-containing protein [Streptomyces sp. 2P-4]|uniref:STAS domain-containing protein n=1 Tax=Streptomyces sp. 2P-4 TaxID=2931974 RepID=UPI002541D872|nr:STAS domain-containing protein [Streptomyces sp. 2P-4]